MKEDLKQAILLRIADLNLGGEHKSRIVYEAAKECLASGTCTDKDKRRFKNYITVYEELMGITE